jgi:cell fate regulator YaaT (PSP1 superfamily)
MHLNNNIVGIQFKKVGKIYNFSYNNIKLKIGDRVLVETEQGKAIGKIVTIGYLSNKKTNNILKPIIKKIKNTEIPDTYKLENDLHKHAFNKAKDLKLNMKILKTEFNYDQEKSILYFSSPGRVDFRELVKTLAKQFKTRVELKQIGARDETKILGGMGICGREFCCSTFLREFIPISIKMAKNQNLALNPTKVSGGCGRLLCCLTYEDSTYTKLRKSLPALGSTVIINDKDEDHNDISGSVIKSDILNQTVTIRTKEQNIIVTKIDKITRI